MVIGERVEYIDKDKWKMDVVSLFGRYFLTVLIFLSELESKFSWEWGWRKRCWRFEERGESII